MSAPLSANGLPAAPQRGSLMEGEIDVLLTEVGLMQKQLHGIRGFVMGLPTAALNEEQHLNVLQIVSDLDVNLSPKEKCLMERMERTRQFFLDTGLPKNREQAGKLEEQKGIVHALAENLRIFREGLKERMAPPNGKDQLCLRAYSPDTLSALYLATYTESPPKGVETFGDSPRNHPHDLT